MTDDPLRVLLADEDRAIEVVARAFWNASRSGNDWDHLDADDRKFWLVLNGPSIRAVLAALCNAANSR